MPPEGVFLAGLVAGVGISLLPAVVRAALRWWNSPREAHPRPLSDQLASAASKGLLVGGDFGGTLSKLVLLEPHAPSHRGEPGRLRRAIAAASKQLYFGGTGKRDAELELAVEGVGALHFVTFQTRRMAGAMELAEKLMGGGSPSESGSAATVVPCTGGGARKFRDHVEGTLRVRIEAYDELECLVGGLAALLQANPHEAFSVRPDGSHQEEALHPESMYPLLLVNIGSGVSIVLVEGPDRWRRVSGTSIGGGTFFGLINMITGMTSFDEMLLASKSGQNSRVDLCVGDIYGKGHSIYGLEPDTIASNFGKVVAVSRLSEVASSASSTSDTAPPGASDSPKSEPGDASVPVPWGVWRRKRPRAHTLPCRPLDQSAETDPLSEDEGIERDSAWAARLRERPVIPRMQLLAPTTAQPSSTEIIGEFHEDGRFHARPEDVCRSALLMVTNQIGQVALLNALLHKVHRVIFAGSFLRHRVMDTAQQRLSSALRFWSQGTVQALFLHHEGYCGALGALLRGAVGAPSAE
jgi:pantothenate kinase